MAMCNVWGTGDVWEQEEVDWQEEWEEKVDWHDDEWGDGPLVGYGWGGMAMHLLLWAHFGSPTFGTAVRALLCRRNMRAWVRARACFVCRLSLLSGLAACIGSPVTDLASL